METLPAAIRHQGVSVAIDLEILRAYEAGAVSVSSTRRFWARPAAVSLDATGLASPKPRADSIAGFTPCEVRKFITVSARFCERMRFEVTPCAASSAPIGVLSV